MNGSIDGLNKSQLNKIKASIKDNLMQMIAELKSDISSNVQRHRVIKTDIEMLSKGEIGFLKRRGLLTGARSSELDVKFNVARTDKQESVDPKVFEFSDIETEDSQLYGVISTFTGSQITNVSGIAELGLYWGEHALPDECSIINVNSGLSGVVGINLDLKQLSEGRPVLLSCGALTTSTVFCGIQGDTLHLYHVGQQQGDYEWSLGNTGVHELLDMCGQFGIVSDDPASVDNNKLMTALASCDAGMVVYNSEASGDITSSPSGTLSFNYHIPRSQVSSLRVGFCYVLLTLIDGKPSVRLYAEDSLVDDGEIVKMLSSQEIKLR